MKDKLLGHLALWIAFFGLLLLSISIILSKLGITVDQQTANGLAWLCAIVSAVVLLKFRLYRKP